MHFRRICIIVVALILCPAVFGAAKKKTAPPPAALSDRDRALHALNRLTFGPRPGDVEKVLGMGVDAWIEQQLQPDSIPNQQLDARLGPYRTLRMQPKDLIANFPNYFAISQTAEGRRPFPTDPTQFGLMEVFVDKYNEQKRNNAAAAAAAVQTVSQPQDDAARRAAAQKAQEDAGHIADMLMSLPKQNRMSTLLKLPVGDRRLVTTSLREDARDRLLADFNPAEREAWWAMSNPTAVVLNELQQAKVLRAVYSERQLEEVMTDFWYNHFNVFLNKDADQYYATAYERDVIRPHALGKFRDLLIATAHSPAMLFYLDNVASIGPNSQAAGGGKRPIKPGQPLPGLNENYARELMELHTLGVDGGYTQADVTEVARVFTGWTIDHPELGGGFLFDPKRHEPGNKTVLGHVIAPAGQDEGQRVLEMLAAHPSTARFISTKLARRFVADDPPASLVNKMAKTFADSDGDIREVLRTMFKSKEFWAPSSYRAKVKTPLEYVISSIRATGTDVQNPMALVGTLARMGMPLYQMAPPTGYAMKAENWINSDALVDRFNYAMTLTSGSIKGVRCDAQRVLALGVLTRIPDLKIPAPYNARGTDAAIALLEDALVGTELSATTTKAIQDQLNDPQVSAHVLDDPGKTLNAVVATIIGSPEFQRR